MKNYCVEHETFLGKENFLGSGLWTKAFFVNGKVVIVTDDQAKECLALFCQGESIHIPELTRLECINEKQAYEMPYYEPLKACHRVAWAQYKALKKAFQSVPYQESTKHVCFEGYRKAVSNCEGITDELKNAVCRIVEEMQNYTDEIFLEISPRNAKVGKNGELILLDIVGISDELKKKRKW